MKRFKMVAWIATAAAALVALLALSTSAFAQVSPPHQFSGSGLDEGDVVAIVGTDDSATADADGGWYIITSQDVADDVDENSFTLNGEAATAELSSHGASLTMVSLTIPEPPAVDCPDDSMMEDDDSMMEDDDSMMEDDAMAEDCPDDSMMDEGDDSMMEDDDSMLDEDDSMMDGEDVGYPDTGTGGIADNGGVSAGLIGLLIALGVAAIAGLGLRRVRNRA